MATRKVDEKHDVTTRPVDKIAPKDYRCESFIGLTDGSMTNSRFVGVGSTPAQAENSAIRQAVDAIHAGRVLYRQHGEEGHKQ